MFLLIAPFVFSISKKRNLEVILLTVNFMLFITKKMVFIRATPVCVTLHNLINCPKAIKKYEILTFHIFILL